jgi:cell division protein FtsB
MRDFQRRSPIRKLAESRPALAILAGILLFSMWNLAVFWRKMVETEKNREIAAERAEGLEESKKNLEAQVGKLQTERGVEEVLREDFGLSRQGEGVIIIVDEEGAETEVKAEKKGFWSWIKGLF